MPIVKLKFASIQGKVPMSSQILERSNLETSAVDTRESPAATGTRDLVVLIHGIAATKYLLVPMAKRLSAKGYHCELHGYYTLRGSIEAIGERFAAKLERLADANPDRKIHIVAHSMGSIVTRCALLSGVPESLGRIVMIGPPNRGSHVARKLTPIYGWFSNTLVELSDVPDSFVNRLPLSVGGYEVGIITAEHDNVVPQGSTLLDDHNDHITLDSLHTSILWRSRTAEHVARFLETGRF